jgi:hypothetical protein
MTRRPPTTTQLLANTARMLNDAATHWTRYEETILEVLEVPLTSGLAGGGSHTSDISDPTATIALGTARLHWATRLADAQTEALELHTQAKHLLALMSSKPQQAVDPQAKRLARCSDPVCEELAVKTGLCQAHYMAARRAAT